MTKITITKKAMTKLCGVATTTGSMTMTEEELARHDSKTLLQLLLSADARCDALTAQLESTLKDRALILAERDLLRALLAEADRRIVWEAHGFGSDFAERVEAALKGESHD